MRSMVSAALKRAPFVAGGHLMIRMERRVVMQRVNET